MIQLNPPLWVETPLGPGWALLAIDYGPDWNLCFLVELHKDGQFKHFDSNDIKGSVNHTYRVKTPQ